MFQFLRWFFSSLPMIVIKVGLAIFIGMGLLYLGACVIGNIDKRPVELPGADKARYELFLPATGQIVYAEGYREIDSMRHEVQGYYELVKGKYRYRDVTLYFDEKYFGDILVKRR